MIEKVLSILEDRWATVIREFRDTSPFTIRKQSRLDIAFYIAVQWIRNRNLGGFVDGSGTHLSSSAAERQIDLMLDLNGELRSCLKRS